MMKSHVDFTIEIEGKLYFDDKTTSVLSYKKWIDYNIKYDPDMVLKQFKAVLKKYYEIDGITLILSYDYNNLIDTVKYIWSIDGIKKNKLNEYNMYDKTLNRWTYEQKNKAKKDVEKTILQYLNRLQEEYIKSLQELLQEQEQAG